MKKRILIASVAVFGSGLIFLGAFAQAHAARRGNVCVVSARTSYLSSLDANNKTYHQAIASSSAELAVALQQAGKNPIAIKTARANDRSAIENAQQTFITARQTTETQFESARKACGVR